MLGPGILLLGGVVCYFIHLKVTAFLDRHVKVELDPGMEKEPVISITIFSLLSFLLILGGLAWAIIRAME